MLVWKAMLSMTPPEMRRAVVDATHGADHRSPPPPCFSHRLKVRQLVGLAWRCSGARYAEPVHRAGCPWLAWFSVRWLRSCPRQSRSWRWPLCRHCCARCPPRYQGRLHGLHGSEQVHSARRGHGTDVLLQVALSDGLGDSRQPGALSMLRVMARLRRTATRISTADTQAQHAAAVGGEVAVAASALASSASLLPCRVRQRNQAGRRWHARPVSFEGAWRAASMSPERTDAEAASPRPWRSLARQHRAWAELSRPLTQASVHLAWHATLPPRRRRCRS